MELKEIVAKLISIDSVSGKEKQACIWASNFLSDNGFSVELQEVGKDRWNVFAKKGSPKAIFFGHLDTVPAVSGWTKKPFSVTHEGDRAYGLGTWDMKGAVSAMLYAAQQAKNMGILLTVDEEQEGLGVLNAVQNRKFFDNIKLLVSGEAGNTQTTYAGIGHVGVGRKGWKGYVITKRLEGGHAATSGNDWVEWLYNAVSGPKKSKSRIIIRNFHATSKGFSVPDFAQADIDVIVEPEERDFDFKKEISGLFKLENGSIEEQKAEYPPYSFAKSPEIANVARIVKEFTEPRLIIGDSVADENVFAAKLGIPIAIMGPEGRNEHHADEWVSLKSLNEMAALYKRIADSY